MKICHNQVTIVNWILFSVFFLFNSTQKKLVRRLSHISPLFRVNDGTKASRPSHTMQYYNYFRARANVCVCVCVCSSQLCQMYTSECERCISAKLDSQHPTFRSNSWELIEFSRIEFTALRILGANICNRTGIISFACLSRRHCGVDKTLNLIMFLDRTYKLVPWDWILGGWTGTRDRMRKSVCHSH